GVVSRSRRLRRRARGRLPRGFFGLLGATALAPALDVGRRKRRLDDLAPVERDAGVLRLERATHLGIERLAPDFHARRRAKPVQNARARLAAPVGRPLHEGEVLEASLIAAVTEQSLLSL